MQARAASERPESKVEIHRAQLWQRWRARWHVFRCGRALIPSLSFCAAVKPSASSTTVRARVQTFRHRLQTARLLAGRAPMSPQPPGFPEVFPAPRAKQKSPETNRGFPASSSIRRPNQSVNQISGMPCTPAAIIASFKSDDSANAITRSRLSASNTIVISFELSAPR